MSDYYEIIEEDKVYLQEVGMRSILQGFVADAIEDQPENVYEYMASWATKKATSQLKTREQEEEDRDDEYPAEEKPKDAAHSNQEVLRPGPALHRHDHGFDTGHPAKEMNAATNGVRGPEVTSKVINGVASAVDDKEEL